MSRKKTTKPVVKCVCGGGWAHHATEFTVERCWCPTCLALPFDDRCTEWRPVEKKPVAREVAPVGHRHPPTAKSAARRVLPKTGSRRWEVYRMIEAAGPYGLTDDELEYKTGKSHQTVSATRNTLMNDGLIEDSGIRRETRYGNEAICWIIATGEAGVDSDE